MEATANEKDFIYKNYTLGKFLERNYVYFADLLIVSSFWFFVGLIFGSQIGSESFGVKILVWILNIIMYAPLPLFFLLIFDFPNKIGLLGIDKDQNIYLRHLSVTSRFNRKEFTGFTIQNYKNLQNTGLIFLKHQSGKYVCLPVPFYGKKKIENLRQKIKELTGLEEINDVFDGNAWYKQDQIKKSSSRHHSENKDNYRYRPGVEIITLELEKKYTFPPILTGAFLCLLSIIIFTIVVVLTTS